MFHVVLGLIPVLFAAGLFFVVMLVLAGLLCFAVALTITIVRSVKRSMQKSVHTVSLVFCILLWMASGIILIPCIAGYIYMATIYTRPEPAVKHATSDTWSADRLPRDGYYIEGFTTGEIRWKNWGTFGDGQLLHQGGRITADNNKGYDCWQVQTDAPYEMLYVNGDTFVKEDDYEKVREYYYLESSARITIQDNILEKYHSYPIDFDRQIYYELIDKYDEVKDRDDLVADFSYDDCDANVQLCFNSEDKLTFSLVRGLEYQGKYYLDSGRGDDIHAVEVSGKDAENVKYMIEQMSTVERE